MAASTLVLDAGSGSESEGSIAETRWAAVKGLPIIAVVGSLAAVGMLCVLSGKVGAPPQMHPGSADLVELASFRGASATGAQQQQLQQVPTQQAQMGALTAQQQAQLTAQQQAQMGALPAQQPMPNGAVAPQAVPGSLAGAPEENLHDGNKCADDEEEHMGLCYEKCSSLTQGLYKFRQTPWTCCNAKVCNPIALVLGKCCKHHMGFCSGFDIAGLREGDHVCPHKPGVCFEDEELFLNMCYMKCSILTQGQFTHRVGAATCCRSNDMSCLLDKKVKVGMHGQSDTNPLYNVGGSCGDGHDVEQCSPHEPQQKLTESG